MSAAIFLELSHLSQPLPLGYYSLIRFNYFRVSFCYKCSSTKIFYFRAFVKELAMISFWVWSNCRHNWLSAICCVIPVAIWKPHASVLQFMRWIGMKWSWMNRNMLRMIFKDHRSHSLWLAAATCGIISC